MDKEKQEKPFEVTKELLESLAVNVYRKSVYDIGVAMNNRFEEQASILKKEIDMLRSELNVLSKKLNK